MSIAAGFDAEGLYVRNVDWLRAWLERRTRCPQKAADLAQDTYCRLIERSGPVVQETARAYLATIARRLLIDDVRHRDVERAIIDALALHDGHGAGIGPDRIVEAVQLLDQVIKVLESLPPQAQKAFLLRRVEGLSQGEVAEQLGISISTVKRHIAEVFARCLAVAYGE